MSSPVAAAARCRAVPCSFCGGSPYRARETEPCTCSLERSSSRSVPLCRGGAIRPLQRGAGMALRFGALSQDSPPGTSHPDLVVRILSRLARPRRYRGWARCAPFFGAARAAHRRPSRRWRRRAQRGRRWRWTSPPTVFWAPIRGASHHGELHVRHASVFASTSVVGVVPVSKALSDDQEQFAKKAIAALPVPASSNLAPAVVGRRWFSWA